MNYLETMQSAFMDELEKIGEHKEAVSIKHVVNAVRRTDDPAKLERFAGKMRGMLTRTPDAWKSRMGDKADAGLVAAHTKLDLPPIGKIRADVTADEALDHLIKMRGE